MWSANKEKCRLACLMRSDSPQSFCDCPMLAQWDPNVCLCRGKGEVFPKLSFSLLTFPQETRSMFSDFGKHQESPGRFVKTKIAGPKLQRLWFSSSGIRTKNLHFWQIPRWCWCHWSGDHTLRTIALGYPKKGKWKPSEVGQETCDCLPASTLCCTKIFPLLWQRNHLSRALICLHWCH